MTYDVTGHFWPTYDIIWHGMWCHMSCTHLVTYDVIAISVIIQLEKCRPPSPWVDMTSHTMSYDIIAHGMWCHMSCTHFVICDVIFIFVITTCLWHHYHELWCHSMGMIWCHIWHHIPIFHIYTFIHDGSTLPSRCLFLVSAPFSLLSLILFATILSVSATDGTTSVVVELLQ